MMQLTKEQQDVLSNIQKEANDKFASRLFKKVNNNEEILFVLDKRLEQDMPEWKRRFYKAVRKDFDKEEMELDENVALEQDQFIDAEIKKAIKRNQLPEYVQSLQDPKTNLDLQKGN